MSFVLAILPFLKAYWKPLAIIGALLSLFLYHRTTLLIAHHQGVIDGKAELQTTIDQDAVTIKQLQGSVKDANSRLDGLATAQAKAQAQSAKALADEQAKSVLWQGQATKLMAIINRPKATDADVCARADALLRAAPDELR